MATELEQLQALTLQVQQLTGAMMDMDKQDVQEIQQRDPQLAEMRGTLAALNTRGSRLNPNRSEFWTQRSYTMCDLSTDIGRHGKPSSSNGADRSTEVECHSCR